jgi:tetratricopeptide (TPR) repeat protein
MINKDYILRLAEHFGRSLAIILRLRQYNQHEEALIYIDDLFLKQVGLTSSFINSLSEEMLVKTFTLMGKLNIQSCLWSAVLLKAEGDIYSDLENPTESYYRYLKALHLFLAAHLQDPTTADVDLYQEVGVLQKHLDEYEIPAQTRSLLFAYYEQRGLYAKAEDVLFDLLETDPKPEIFESGKAFYGRLQTRSVMDLRAGNLSQEEVSEGLAHLQLLEQKT